MSIKQINERNAELAQLLARVALRDRAAFARLYELSSAHLYGAALRILKRPAWAEEVLQESFINVWQYAQSYRQDKSQPYTWLTRIVRNRALDWLRRKEPEMDDIDDEAAPAIADQRPDPLELFVAGCDALNIKKCMEELDGSQQQSLALAFYHGLTHAELAKQLRQPLGTIKSWIRRGLQKMRHCLESVGQ